VSVEITTSCITCGACVWECPTEAVVPGDPRPVVRAERCTECFGFFGESQCGVVCPVDAIVLLPEPTSALAARFAELHPGREPENHTIWRRDWARDLRAGGDHR
jgi:ferredoxin